ncbi:sacsin N-terminal ATP-binding-like domain-containing protein [Nakamurella deserti]|uniref:sacsin N-terminal ATP-binding-like domain-containing protein n=1 Tax=Nakamurella deserti TaxID=2164074 RepID=UPI000DBE1A99|nr:hypothetical protein [Nakamurella deserti]
MDVTGSPAADDPFDTAALRAAVLDIWRRSPARLREDANAEEALAVVGYAGRVLVELIANAADAAIAAVQPARIRITTRGGELRVANTGAPLTAAGVASLASLRASAKTGDAGVGHFGVGFTAVLAVSDQPSVVSTTGSVRFDAADTAVAVARLADPALDAVVAARDGHVPALRLPWPTDGTPPEGFSTEVRLPLRHGIAAADVLAEIGDHLLLALPAVERLEVDDRVLARLPSDDDTVVLSDSAADTPVTRWRLASRAGRWDAARLAGLPTEQRRRARWQLTWAHPTTRPLGPDVLYAPTPTDEPLGLPARLIGTFPVDDTRRHLAAGPLVEALLDEAVAGYLDLMAATDPDARLGLLPAAGLGRGELDSTLRRRITDAVRGARLLVSASGEAVRPADAVMLPGADADLVALAAEALPGLLPPVGDTVAREALRSLGVRTVTVADLSTALGALARDARFWGRLYAVLDETGAAGDDLADLPVPLAGGRTVLGARGCLVADGPAPWLDAAVAAVPGLRLVHPDATADPVARRLLLRIGAVRADATGVLGDPAVLRAVAELRADLEEDDVPVERVVAVGTAVLDLVAAGGAPGADVSGDLLLTTDDDEPWPVTELTLPGSPLAAILVDAELEPVGSHWTDGWSDDVLRRAGVLGGFRVIEDTAPTGPDHDLPDEDRWWDEVVGNGPPPAVLTAVADLDLVADDRWPAALQLIADDRAARDSLAPVAGRPSYTAWWLGRFARLADRPPTAWRLPGAADLVGLFDPLPVPLPEPVAAAIGVRNGAAQVLADDPVDLLRRFCDPARTVPAVRVPALTAALTTALAGVRVAPLPSGVRVLTGTVVDAGDAAVLDLPWFAAVVDPARTVPGGADPAAVAGVFDLDLVSERHPVERVTATPTSAVRPTAAGAALGVTAGAVAAVGVDPDLRVRIAGTDHRVPWWVSVDGAWVDGSAAGWGRMLAWLAGDWALRHTATAWVVGDTPGVVEDGLTGPARRRPSAEES